MSAKLCPRGVNRATLTVRRSLPVYPGKQTISEPVGTLRLYQYRKWPARRMRHFPNIRATNRIPQRLPGECR